MQKNIGNMKKEAQQKKKKKAKVEDLSKKYKNKKKT